MHRSYRFAQPHYGRRRDDLPPWELKAKCYDLNTDIAPGIVFYPAYAITFSRIFFISCSLLRTSKQYSERK